MLKQVQHDNLFFVIPDLIRDLLKCSRIEGFIKALGALGLIQKMLNQVQHDGGEDGKIYSYFNTSASFCCNAFSLNEVAMILPWGSSRTL